jgi:hypothetical protein
MIDIEMTRHADKRIQQRGISKSDIDIVLRYGEEIEGQGLLMTNKVADDIIGSLKSQIVKIERLRNTKLVVDGAAIITCYPCGNREKRRMKKRMRRS